MDNRRAAARQRKLKSGKVSFGSCQVPCTVRSLSESGACLQVQTTYGIPGTFELALSGEHSKACKVTWADEKRLGVQFT
jgi:PilZ domain